MYEVFTAHNGQLLRLYAYTAETKTTVVVVVVVVMMMMMVIIRQCKEIVKIGV